MVRRGTFLQQSVVSGLSSGEGLIHQVRNATLTDGAVIDEDCTDKRRRVVESEFGGTLRIGRLGGTVCRPCCETPGTAIICEC